MEAVTGVWEAHKAQTRAIGLVTATGHAIVIGEALGQRLQRVQVLGVEA